MQIGDSILIPAKTEMEKYRIQRNVCTVISKWSSYHEENKKFVTKAEDKGIRVWRIE